MKIRDLNINDYVIVYDLGKSEYSGGMTVVRKFVGKGSRHSVPFFIIRTATGQEYEISNDNYFDLWSNYIESKTESVSTPNLGKIYSYINSTVGPNEEIISHSQSNDLQQRKRNDTVNHPSHYNYGDIEVIDFIEQVTKHYNPNVAYHIGNAIKYLARSPHKNGKEDVDKARWYIERAFENWDVK
ncbi:DUF3310 domain-containing protein [Staphylococcus nepalensis]|uniref:DUF3310 domain-containing protein n=1 Tax=Staphylococcus nepalensis TaxID=214473 RepID=UPI0021006253|nr:DUF3310 domain-containing protein [Staphylococcus nepalensis]